MLGLREKEKCVVVIRPSVLWVESHETNRQRVAEIEAALAEADLEVSQRKNCYLSEDECKPYASEEGYVEVLLIEHLDNDTVTKTAECLTPMMDECYFSTSQWESIRDMEYFFPSLEGQHVERTLAIIKPGSGEDVESYILNSIWASGIFVVFQKKDYITAEQVKELYPGIDESSQQWEDLLNYLTNPQSGPSTLMVLEGAGAVNRWRLLAGPEDREKAANTPTIRGNFGISEVRDVVHCSASATDAKREIECLFKASDMVLERTLCLVKPEAAEHVQGIRSRLEKVGFSVTKQDAITLTEVRAEEFLKNNGSIESMNSQARVTATIRHLCSGPCVAFVLTRVGAVNVLKQLLGPDVPRAAKLLNPSLLRAVYGRDGLRNGFYASDSTKSAALDVGFFFPDLGVHGELTDEEVTDYFYRKTALAQMSLPEVGSSVLLDSTLQQFVNESLLELCRVRHQGTDALNFLATYFENNNPNRAQLIVEEKPAIEGQKQKEYYTVGTGETAEGETFEVEVAAKPKYDVIEVDVREEPAQNKKITAGEFASPPLVVFVCGGPGSGKGTQCAKIAAEFGYVHLSCGDLIRAEVNRGTRRGLEMADLMKEGKLVPDEYSIELLRNAMLENQEVNRFLIDGFPRSIQQGVLFEKDVAECSIVLQFEASDEACRERILERGKTSGRADDNEATLEKRLKTYHEQTIPVLDYYRTIGRLRTVDANQNSDKVWEQTRSLFLNTFVYLIGTEGMKLTDALEMGEPAGYAHIGARAIYSKFVKASPIGKEGEVEKVKKALADNKLDLEPSVSCPLIIAEVENKLKLGHTKFLFTDFPKTQKQKAFLEYRIKCNSKAIVFQYSQRDATELGIRCGNSQAQVENDCSLFYGQELAAMTTSMVRQAIPMTIPRTNNDDSPEAALKKDTWKKLQMELRDKVTIVIGPPGCCQKEICRKLALRHPNNSSIPVDVDELLDKELERETEIGVVMHNMLSKGQVVPISITFQLLKNLARFGVEHLCLENFPTNVDEIKYIREELEVQDVFSLMPEGQGSRYHWQQQFMQKKQTEDSANMLVDYEIMFSERFEQLVSIHNDFAASGDEKLYPLAVGTQDTSEMVFAQAEAKLRSKYILLTGLPFSGTTDIAEEIEKNYPLMRVAGDTLFQFSLDQGLTFNVDGVELTEAGDLGQLPGEAMAEIMRAFFQFYDVAGNTMFLIENLPLNSDHCQEMIRVLGPPKAAYYFKAKTETCVERAAAFNASLPEPQALDNDALAAEYDAQMPLVAGIFERLQDDPDIDQRTKELYQILDGDENPLMHYDTVTETFKAAAFLIISPGGKNLPRHVGTALANRLDDVKLIDASGLMANAEKVLKDDLLKAFEPELYRIRNTNVLPSAALWEELFRTVKDKNPQCSNFIITNFLSNSNMETYPTIRDLLDTLERLMDIHRIVYCKFQSSLNGEPHTEELQRLSEPEDIEKIFESMEYIANAYDLMKIHSVEPDAGDTDTIAYAARVADSLTM